MRFALLLLCACGTARRGMPLVGTHDLTEEAAFGEAVFAKNCHECHPQGEGGLGPPIHNRALPGFAIRSQVRLGVGAMPAFSKAELPPDELDAVVAYLLELKDHRGPTERLAGP